MRTDSPPSLDLPGFALRQIERRDRQQWFDYLSLPDVHERTSWNLRGPEDLDPLFESFESTLATSPRRLAVIDTSNERLAGTIGFHTISDLNRSAEIAYDLAPAYWGRGLATYLCERVTRWGFGALDFIRVQATVLVGNERSDRVLLKCGFRHEGLLRSYRLVRGTPGDFNLYARLATDSDGDSPKSAL